MNIRAFLIVFLCWPMYAMSAEAPTPTSKIPGVQLWEVSRDDGNKFPSAFFYDGDNEFIKYCNGIQTIHVRTVIYDESFNSSVRCKSTKIAETENDHFIIQLKVNDKRLFNCCAVVLVSKKSLPERAKTLPITKKEYIKLRKAEKTLALIPAFAEKVKQDFWANDNDNEDPYKERYIKTIRKYGFARFKLSSPEGNIYISSIGNIIPDIINMTPDHASWDVINIVFREIDGKLKKIGDIIGCIDEFRDLNADGIPEVLTHYCGMNDEGSAYAFWSLTPKVRSVVWLS